MTHNQIEYWKVKESERAAKVGERQKDEYQREYERSNRARESIDLSKLSETQRSNKARESIDLSKLAETQRHNVQTENLDLSKLGETTRHNMATENIDRDTLSERIRSNKANEGLIAQSNAIQATNVSNNYNLGLLDKQVARELGYENIRVQDARTEVSKLTQQADQAYKEAMTKNANDQMNAQRGVNAAKIAAANNSYQLAKKQYDLAMQSYELDKSQANWKNMNDSLNTLIKAANAMSAMSGDPYTNGTGGQ